MKNLSIFALLINLVLALLIGGAVGQVYASVPVFVATSSVVFASGFFVKYIPGLTFMALQTEVWVQDIEEVLFEGIEFLRFSVDHSAFIVNKKVHVPQAGANPTVEKNRSVLPATITQRTDTDLEYNLDEYTTDPILITNIDELQTSYSKRQSVLNQHTLTLTERIGIQGLFDWSPSGAGDSSLVIRTTGADGSSLPPGATGTRKEVTKKDIARLAAILDKDKAPKTGRYLMFPVDPYYELFEIDSLTNRNFLDVTTIPTGVINKLFNFNVMMRADTVIYNDVADPVKKAIGAATATDDNFSILAWQSTKVSRAEGSIEVFSKERQPEFFGDVFSALVMFATSPLRTGKEGIAVLVQDET